MSDTPNQTPMLPRTWQQIIASVLLAIVATLALTGRITWQKAEEIAGSGDLVTVKAPTPKPTKRIAWKLANELAQPTEQQAAAEANDPASITPDQILQIITLVEQVAPKVQQWLPTIMPIIDQFLRPNQPPVNPPNNPPNNPPVNPPAATGLRIVFTDATGKQLGAAQMQVAALVLQPGQTMDFVASDAGPAITVRTGGAAPIVTPVQPVTPTPVVTGASDFAAEIANQAQAATGTATLRTSSLVDSLLTLALQGGTPKAVTDAIRQACPAIGMVPARDLTPGEIQAIRSVR